MWNPPTTKQLMLVPPIGAQEKEKDPKVYLKFFMGSWTWYITEYDPATGNMFGYTVSGIDPSMSEWGYTNLLELMRAKTGFVEVDRDVYSVNPRKPVRFSDLIKRDFSQTWNQLPNLRFTR